MRIIAIIARLFGRRRYTVVPYANEGGWPRFAVIDPDGYMIAWDWYTQAHQLCSRMNKELSAKRG